MKDLKVLEQFKYCKFSRPVNLYNLPKNEYKFGQEGADKWNELLEFFEEEYKPEDWTIIQRTPSGGIKNGSYLMLPAWAVWKFKSRVEMVILTYDFSTRFILGRSTQKDGSVSGFKAYRRFRDICKKFNVDLDEFAIDNGEEVKQDFEKPMIECYVDEIGPKHIYENVHHIDLNSSYMSGIAHYYPELREPIQYIFDRRKQPGQDKLFKGILNSSYGFFQSEFCRINGHKFALAELSVMAISFNNTYIRALKRRLVKAGCKILLCNTDGIWYQGDKMLIEGPTYCDDIEMKYGTDLGQYKYDHSNCKLRIASKGAYEYIENGKYTAVVRGETNLDKYKDRKDWEWGDIFKGEARKVLVVKLPNYFKEDKPSTWHVSCEEDYV